MPLRIDRVSGPRTIPPCRWSSGVATQIFETPRKISDHSKQHVHGASCGAASLPLRPAGAAIGRCTIRPSRRPIPGALRWQTDTSRGDPAHPA